MLPILLGTAGFLGNWYNLQLFFNVDFLFGSFFVMLAIARCGLLGGAVAGLISASCSYFLWNHPWAVIIFTLEACCVAAANRRRPSNLLILDTLYWLFLGIPLVWLFYHFVMGMGAESTWLVALKQSINGIFNVLLATICIYFGKIKQVDRANDRRVPFQQLIFTGMVAVALLPAFGYMIFDIRDEMRNEEDHIRLEVLAGAEHARQDLETWITANHQTVIALAQRVGNPNRTAFKTMQSQVETLKLGNTSLQRLGVFNAKAITVAYAPLIDNTGRSTLGLDFSDRPFIPIIKQTLRPMVADVVLGRIDAPKPMVPLIAPIVDAGQYQGYAVGILNFDRLAQQLEQITKSPITSITILDRERRVISTTSTQWRPLQTFVRPTGGETRLLADGVYHWLPKKTPGKSVMQRWRGSVFAKEVILGREIPWTLVIEASLLPQINIISKKTIHDLEMMWGLVLLTLGLSGVLCRQFVISLRQLEAAATSALPPHQRPWPDSGIQELHSLTSAFRTMTGALEANVQQLLQMNDELEQRVEQRAREVVTSEQRYRKVVESSPNLIMVHCEGMIVYLNPTAIAKFGADTVAQLIDTPVLARIHPDYRNMVTARISQSSDQVQGVQEEFLRLDGTTFPVSVTTAPFEFDGRPAVLTIAVDITARKLAEQKLLELNAELEQRVADRTVELASANKDLESFCYSISHELRAPIARLEGFSRLVAESAQAGDTSNLLHHAERIAFSSRRLMTVVDSLLMMNRVARVSIHSEEVNLSELAREVVIELADDAGQRQVAVSIAPDLLARGDRTMLMICLQNLLGNSFKYTMKTAAPAITFAATNQAGKTVYFVRDNGAGFDMAFANKLFQPFSRLHSNDEFEGNGIGLATVQRIIEKHGGTIWADAKPGAGAAFFFTLGS